MNSNQKYWLKIAKEHRNADRFLQGEWIVKGEGNIKKGCFYGCMMQTDQDVLAKAAKKLELPLWLVHLSEKIFEGLPPKLSVEFPVNLLESAFTCKDYEKAYNSFFYKMLMDAEKGQIIYSNDEKTKQAIKACAMLFKAEAEAEAEAAWSAAWSADSAAWSAAWSADSAAWSAKSEARSAHSAARSAVWSAEAAWYAKSEARSAHFEWMANLLMTLLKRN